MNARPVACVSDRTLRFHPPSLRPGAPIGQAPPVIYVAVVIGRVRGSGAVVVQTTNLGKGDQGRRDRLSDHGIRSWLNDSAAAPGGGPWLIPLIGCSVSNEARLGRVGATGWRALRATGRRPCGCGARRDKRGCRAACENRGRWKSPGTAEPAFACAVAMPSLSRIRIRRSWDPPAAGLPAMS